MDGDLPTISDDLVVTKYKMAAEIVNKVLKEMVEACTPGSSVRDLCILGDKKLVEETGKAFKKDKKLTKGKILEFSEIDPMFCCKVSPSPHASPATTASATTPPWPARLTPLSLTGTS